jgi:glycerate kinase
MTVVLVASDKFKGSLTAGEVAQAVEAGVRRARPDVEVVAVPVADGGDGTVAAAVAAGFAAVPVTAAGPTGEPVATCYARKGDVAVVELADVSGLGRLPGGKPAPMQATSRGTGEVLAAAIEAGCTRVVMGIGGSASTDGGAGLVQALGGRLRDAAGREIEPGGAALADLVEIDLSELRERVAGVRVVVACDVDNPLTGRHGAAAVYGPQKGASQEQVARLDRALGHWADLVEAATGDDRRDTAGAGAAGGVGFAALALLGAELRPGIDIVLDLVGFHELLADVDLVVTGEGSLDLQTLNGKAPAGVAEAARSAGIPTVAVCGRSTLSTAELASAGIRAAYALLDIEPDVQRCMENGAALLEQLGEQLAVEQLTPLAHNDLTPSEMRHLRRCIELAREALEAGDEPFGSVLVAADGNVLAEDRNRVADGDQTQHPEFALARWAASNMTVEERAGATVFTSGEHCPMCSAAHGWVGLGRIVYVHSSAQLAEWLTQLGVPAPPVRTIPIREVAPGVEVAGPVPELVGQMRALHERLHRGTDETGEPGFARSG